jgi:glutamate dehydrogenase/leucine dehydrogenase
MARLGHFVREQMTSHPDPSRRVGTVGSMAGFDLLDVAADHGCEALHLASDPETGLRAIVAVHSTALGPSLGGTRFRPYPDEHAAAVDVCRLARGMTYKHAACGNDSGGGKAVLIGEPAALRSDDLLRAYGRFLDSLGGVYLTAEDVGTTQADMDALRSHTPYVTGTSEHLGGSGDPSPATAWGVFHAIGAVATRLWGGPDVAGRHVVVLGVGKVGGELARHLHAAGARLTLADVRDDAVRALAAELDAEVVDPVDALSTTCDVLAPCALGAVLSSATIPDLRCAAVCGAANNQLDTDDDAVRLADAGVLYAPDYVVNAGGVINIADETAPGGYDRERAWRRVEGIAETLRNVFRLADERGITTGDAADRLAEERLAAATARGSA